jgi:hypothetical protein
MNETITILDTSLAKNARDYSTLGTPYRRSQEER